MKNGKVLSSLTLPSLERSLRRWENFIIKLRNVKKMFSFHLSRTIAFLSLLCSAWYSFWAQNPFVKGLLFYSCLLKKMDENFF